MDRDDDRARQRSEPQREEPQRVPDEVKTIAWSDRAMIEAAGGDRLKDLEHHDNRLADGLKQAHPSGFNRDDVERAWARHEAKYPRSDTAMDAHQRDYADVVAAAYQRILDRAPAADARPAPTPTAPERAGQGGRPDLAPAEVARPTPDARPAPPVTPQDIAVVRAEAQERIVRPPPADRTAPDVDARSISQDRNRTPDYYRTEVKALREASPERWAIVDADVKALRAIPSLDTPQRIERQLEKIANEREVIRTTDPARADLLNVRALALAALLDERTPKREAPSPVPTEARSAPAPERSDERAPAPPDARTEARALPSLTGFDSREPPPIEDRVIKVRIQPEDATPIFETPSGLRVTPNAPTQSLPAQEVTASLRSPSFDVSRDRPSEEGPVDVDRVVFRPAVTRAELGLPEQPAVRNAIPLDDARQRADEPTLPVPRHDVRDDVRAPDRDVTAIDLRIVPEKTTRTLPAAQGSLSRSLADLEQDHSPFERTIPSLRNEMSITSARLHEQSDVFAAERAALRASLDAMTPDDVRETPQRVDDRIREEEPTSPMLLARPPREQTLSDDPERTPPVPVRLVRSDDENTPPVAVRILSVPQRSDSGVFRETDNDTATMRAGRPAPARAIEPTRADIHRTQLRSVSEDLVRPTEQGSLQRFAVQENVAIHMLRVHCQQAPGYSQEATRLAREAIKDEPGLQTYRDLRRHLASLENDADPNERAALLDAMVERRNDADGRAGSRFARETTRLLSASPAETERRITEAAQVLARAPDLAHFGRQLNVVTAYELGLLPPGKDTARQLDAIYTHAALSDRMPSLIEKRSPANLDEVLGRARSMNKEAVTQEAIASHLRAAVADGPTREAAIDTAYAWAIALENA